MICRSLLRLIAIPTIVVFVLFLVIQPEAIDARGGGGGGRGGGGGERGGGGGYSREGAASEEGGFRLIRVVATRNQLPFQPKFVHRLGPLTGSPRTCPRLDSPLTDRPLRD